MSRLLFSFSKSLVTTTALAFISASCLSSLAFAMDHEENEPCKSLIAAPPSPLENNPTVINSILVFLDPKSLLDMGTTNRSFHQICSNSDLWDVLFQRNLYPSISLTSLHLKSPSSYYGLAHLLQEVLLPSAVRQGSEFTIPKPREWWEDMISQAFPEHSPQGNYLLGLVYEACSLNQEALDAYKKAADAGYVNAQSKVANALYRGSLGQGTRPQQERFNELKLLGVMGDQNAQKLVNKALYEGYLGQDGRPEQERFEELKADAAGGDQHAQGLVSMALFWGKLGQSERSEEERFAELKTRAAGGDQSAQSCVNLALHSGALGQDARPEQDRFQELKERAAGGDQNAQKMVNETLYWGQLGQSERSEEERFAELRTRAAGGDQEAQKQVNEALYSGTFGQNARSGKERFEELKTRAANGDQDAQVWVNMALYGGHLGQGTRSQQESVKELISNVKNDITYTKIGGAPQILNSFIFPLLKSLREGK